MAAGTAMLIGMGIKAGVDIYNAKKQKNATEQATQTQVSANQTAAQDTRESTMRALDYINRARTMPGQAPGPAQSYLSNLMGMPAQRPTGPRYEPPQLPSGYQALMGPIPGAPPPVAAPMGRSGRNAGGAPMVMMVAPDGERAQVPASEVARLEREGARRL